MIKYIDLFCGIGAFHMALSEYSEFECVFACDIDNTAQQIYETNYNIKPFGDINSNIYNIPKFDILCAGFPCQPFSIAGNKDGFDNTQSGNLFYSILKVIDQYSPKICILENVKNLETHKNGTTLKIIYDELLKRNYNVTHKVINSAKCGSPQARKRIFIIASQNKIQIPQYPEIHNTKYVCDILDNVVDPKLYWIPIDGKHILKPKINKSKKHSPNILFDIYSQKTTKGGRQGERIYSVNNVGITICASSGGPGSKTGLYSTNDGIRKLSLLETKRMFGFPDIFNMMNISEEKAKSYFGNSIDLHALKSIIVPMIVLYFKNDLLPNISI